MWGAEGGCLAKMLADAVADPLLCNGNPSTTHSGKQCSKRSVGRFGVAIACACASKWAKAHGDTRGINHASYVMAICAHGSLY